MRLKSSTAFQRLNPDEQDKEIDQLLAAKRAKLVYAEEWVLFVARVVLLSSIVFLTVAVLGTFVWHMIGPQPKRWLSVDEEKHIRDLAVTIIAGLLMSMITTYIYNKKRPAPRAASE